MTPLPAAFGGTGIMAWRIDSARFAAAWDSGEGAFRSGGRWNAPGRRVVYCALDPATAILEVAVHKGFATLDTVPHVMSAIDITDTTGVHVVWPGSVPNPNWLSPGTASAGQQAFGNDLVARHKLVLVPSVVSTNSWNLMFDPARASGAVALNNQQNFALDPRLHPPVP